MAEWYCLYSKKLRKPGTANLSLKPAKGKSLMATQKQVAPQHQKLLKTQKRARK